VFALVGEHEIQQTAPTPHERDRLRYFEPVSVEGIPMSPTHTKRSPVLSCIRSGLSTRGLVELAAAEPFTWDRRLRAGVPGALALGPRTTLLEVGHAGAWETLLPWTDQASPKKIVANRRAFARLAALLGRAPVLAIGETVLAEVRALLAVDKNGRARDPAVVRRELRLLRDVIWHLQEQATGRPLIRLEEARTPKRARVWIDRRFVERLLVTRPCLKTLAALAFATSGISEAEALRFRVGSLKLIQGRLGVCGFSGRDGHRRPGRFVLVRPWARPVIEAWARACREAGLRDGDCAFASATDPRRPASGLGHLVDAACRRAGLPQVQWRDWGRLREPVRPGIVAFALGSSAASPTAAK
jgi:hypothetical protein